MSFIDLASQLSAKIPGLSPVLADTYINYAWRDVRDLRLWSFLQDDCAIYCPAQVTTGAVSITQFSADVTLDATASAAFLAISLPSPLTGTALQIRFGGSGGVAQVGQVYSITAVDSTVPAAVVLTLDRLVMESTNATAGYQVYRCYIRPTVTDFLKWVSIDDMTNGYTLRRDYSSSYFDVRDPQRQAQGLAYYIGGFKGNPGTQPGAQYELWPHPTSGQVFYCRYQRSGEDFTANSEQQAPIIPDQLIIERALGYYAYPWAQANAGHFPALKQLNWPSLVNDSKRAFAEMLITAKKQDDEQQLSRVWNRGHGLITRYSGARGMWGYPIDTNFMQSHLINF